MYIDLLRAFDCLDHNILLSKLKFYVLNDNAIRLLKKYLSDRDQYVQLGNIKSKFHGILCRIPQGSVMDPLLYKIIINDFKAATKTLDLILYADDTTLNKLFIVDICGLITSTFSKLRVAFNNVYRRVLGLPQWSSASGMYVTHNIENFEALLRKTLYGFVQRLENSSNKIIATLIKSWTVRFVDRHCWKSRLYT